MDNILSKVIEAWEEKSQALGHTNELNVKEAAVNCISLSSAWFSNAKQGDSFEVVIYNKESEVSDALCGVGEKDVPLILLERITFHKDRTSKVVLNSFRWIDGQRKVTQLGVLEIE